MPEPRQLDDATVEAIARFLLDYNNEARARLAEAEVLLRDAAKFGRQPSLFPASLTRRIDAFLAGGDSDA